MLQYLSKTYASRLDVEKAEKTLDELELQQDENGKFLNIPASALRFFSWRRGNGMSKIDLAKRAIKKCRREPKKSSAMPNNLIMVTKEIGISRSQATSQQPRVNRSRTSSKQEQQMLCERFQKSKHSFQKITI